MQIFWFTAFNGNVFRINDNVALSLLPLNAFLLYLRDAIAWKSFFCSTYFFHQNNIQKFMMIIKSKRVSNSSNIIQKREESSFSHWTVIHAPLEMHFWMLHSINFYDASSGIPTFECTIVEMKWLFTYFTRLLWSLMCVALLLPQPVRNYDYLYFWSFPYFAINPEYFQNNLTASSDVFMWYILIRFHLR